MISQKFFYGFTLKSAACAPYSVEVVEKSMRVNRYGDDPISIAIDGGKPVDAEFHVEGEHTFVLTTESGDVYRCVAGD